MMKRVAAFLFVLALVAVPARAQQHLIGEVTAADAASGAFTVKTDAGESVAVTTDEKTSFRRVPPGQTTLENAEHITRADVSLGDRVLVPGGLSAGGASVRQLIVMSRSALADRGEREREDWRQRGINGRVVSVDAARQEITVETRSRGGVENLTVAAPSAVRFRRYAPDSLRPSDAVSGAFSDIRVGDQLRALGDRSADGSRLTAEEVITGSLARVAGTIAAVDASRGEITVRDTQSGQTFTVASGRRTTLRRIPNDIAERFSQMRGGPNAGAQGRGREGRGPGGEGRGERRGAGQAGQTGQTGQAGQPGQRGGERPRAAGGGLQQLFENLPVITMTDLRVGDAVIAMGTAGSSAERMTAASLLTGSPELLAMLQRFGGGQGGRGNMSTGLPGNVMGGGTGGDRDDPRNR